jgi:hypothetical protein
MAFGQALEIRIDQLPVWTRKSAKQIRSSTIGALACALAKAQAELSNPKVTHCYLARRLSARGGSQFPLCLLAVDWAWSANVSASMRVQPAHKRHSRHAHVKFRLRIRRARKPIRCLGVTCWNGPALRTRLKSRRAKDSFQLPWIAVLSLVPQDRATWIHVSLGLHIADSGCSNDIVANSTSNNPTGSGDRIPSRGDKVRRRTDRAQRRHSRSKEL